MKSNFQTRFLWPLALVAATLPALLSAQAQQGSSNLSPKQQITGFYATCKNGEGGKGLRELLSTNPVVKAGDVDRVAQSFEGLLNQMGKFLDFNISREKLISDRTVIIRCVAHFERQPFVNEFTFYDSGDQWRLVHLRYDANLATMFSDELREPVTNEN